MAKNIQNVRFLRNNGLFDTHDAAYAALTGYNLTDAQDGTIILARYSSSGTVKTLAGLVYFASNNLKSITIIDVEGASGDVKTLREEINAKLGNGIGSGASETVTAQLTALSGNDQSTSAETSVAGAKKYADAKISELDVAAITAGEGQFIKSVSQADGKISATTEAMPTVAAISETGQAITAVSQSNGTVSAVAGDIAAEHVTVADNGDNFTGTTVEDALAEIADEIDAMDLAVVSGDGEVITAVSEEDGKVSASKTAIKDVKLTGYVKNTTATGAISATDDIEDALSKLENTIGSNEITNADGSITVTPANGSTTDVKVHIKDGEKVIKLDASKGGIYTDIDLVKITENLPAEIKERYQLLASDDTQIGANIDIYKDSHIVSISYDKDTQELVYTYLDVSGSTKETRINLSELVIEAEFQSGVTATDHVVHGVVDSTSESFLTVGTNGFKLAGVQDAIDTAISGLDATVGSTTIETDKHVAVEVVETDGKLTALTINENNIADADDLAALSAKTITDVKSANGSVTVTPTNATDGTKEIDLATDADKIKMSGFSADNASALSGIAESDSIATAFEKTNTVITENERVTANALTDLDGRVDTISGDVETISGKVDTIETKYVSGVSVNGSAVTVANHVAPISIIAATTETTASNGAAISVVTDADGQITLGLADLDAGTYDPQPQP